MAKIAIFADGNILDTDILDRLDTALRQIVESNDCLQFLMPKHVIFQSEFSDVVIHYVSTLRSRHPDKSIEVIEVDYVRHHVESAGAEQPQYFDFDSRTVKAEDKAKYDSYWVMFDAPQKNQRRIPSAFHGGKTCFIDACSTARILLCAMPMTSC